MLISFSAYKKKKKTNKKPRIGMKLPTPENKMLKFCILLSTSPI